MEDNLSLQEIESLKEEMLQAKMFENISYPPEVEATNEQKLQVAFETLGLNEKRDIFNQELFRICGLVGTLMEDANVGRFRNYDSIQDQELSEEEFLSYEYQNVLLIRDLILEYISYHQ